MFIRLKVRPLARARKGNVAVPACAHRDDGRAGHGHELEFRTGARARRSAPLRASDVVEFKATRSLRVGVFNVILVVSRAPTCRRARSTDGSTNTPMRG